MYAFSLACCLAFFQGSLDGLDDIVILFEDKQLAGEACFEVGYSFGHCFGSGHGIVDVHP